MTITSSPTTALGVEPDQPQQDVANGERPESQPSNEGALDGLMLTSLMSSKLCHDLVNPIGALASGLDVLEDSDDDKEMQEEALALLKSSADKATALLKFARVAYGLSGGLDTEVGYDEVRSLLDGLYAHTKATLDWQVQGASAPKTHAKALMIMVQTAAESVPRGGVVTVSGEAGRFRMTATGDRVLLNDAVGSALSGVSTDLMPKCSPLFLVGTMAREQGGKASAKLEDGVATFELVMPV
ncbi:MAG: histidine phosphotransferase family protein [Pseudomonadota bacterium]